MCHTLLNFTLEWQIFIIWYIIYQGSIIRIMYAFIFESFFLLLEH